MSKPNHIPGRCKATTKAGKPCPAPATASGMCYLHEHPAAEIGRRGGLKNRHVVADDSVELPPLNTAEEVRCMLTTLAKDLRAGRVEPRVATSLAQLANSLLRAIEVSDLEKRLARLEGKTSGER